MRLTLFGVLLTLAVATRNHPSFFRRRNAANHWSTEYPVEKAFAREIDRAVTISVTPGGPLTGDTVLVTVTWAGVTAPTTQDWIGFYCPGNSDDHDYLDYAWNDKKTASGSIQFNVTNMRDDFQFRYIANNTAYIVLALSNVVAWTPHQPGQGNIALTGKAGEMSVHWNSDYNTDVPSVEYGTSSGKYTTTVNGTSETYKNTDLCNAPANTVNAVNYRNPGFFHNVLLTGLQSSTRYFYRYGQNGVWSDEHSFQIAPPVGPTTDPLKFVMYGDQGVVGCFRTHGACSGASSTVARVLNEIKTNNVNLVLHIGDISYAVGYGYLWEMYGVEIEPVSTAAPYMVGNGNHEYDHTGTGGNDPSNTTGSGFHPPWGNFGDDSGGECSVPFFHRYKMPANGNYLFWYSFEYGPIHFIMMSSEHDWQPGSVQYAWLEKDLASVNHQLTPWVILSAHRPMYSSENYQGDWTVAQHMQTAFESLLKQYQVDLMLTGHYHAYERTCPVYQQACCPAGQNCTTHIVAGMGGIELDTAGWFKTTWSVYHDESHFGYIRVTITSTPKSSLFLEYVNDGDGKVLDSVTLTK